MRRQQTNANATTNTRTIGFRKMVEAKVKSSATLPTMSFETAKNYYRHLETELGTINPEIADNLSAQYKELADIFGVKPNVNSILRRRYEASGLKCGFDNVKEYLSLLMAQRSNMADPSKDFALENEIQKAEFCLFL